MADTKKPEINLEISSGFFRIPTEEVIYNITVIGDKENSVAKVVEQIVKEEKRAEAPDVVEQKEEAQPELEMQAAGDDFYRDISAELYSEIGKLAKQLSTTMQDIPAEDRRKGMASLDEAGERIEDAKSQLKDIVSMTEQATMEIMDQVEKVQGLANEMQETLSVLKDHNAFEPQDDVQPQATMSAEESLAIQEASTVDELQDLLEKARKIITSLQEESVTASLLVEESVQDKSSANRQPFELDTVLQTVYELCTNETVKSHIAHVRENASSIVSNEDFDRQLQEKTAELAAGEDNFLEVPISDVLGALLAACQDEKIQNLFKRMEATKAELFTVDTLPLEMPGSIQEKSDEADVINDTDMADPRVFELAKLMEGSLALTESLSTEKAAAAQTSPEGTALSSGSLHDVHEKLEQAFNIASKINADVGKIMELLSFQDLSGQQILKIIKLLSDFQTQLMAIVVSFGCRLKSKAKNAAITVEESKRLAQQDVDSYFDKLSGAEDEETPMLDQNAVNSLLEDLGF